MESLYGVKILDQSDFVPTLTEGKYTQFGRPFGRLDEAGNFYNKL